MVVSDDRWTCPRCQETTVVDAGPADRRIALTAVRDGHLCPSVRRAAVIARCRTDLCKCPLRAVGTHFAECAAFPYRP